MDNNLFKVLDREKCIGLNLSIDRSCAVLCSLAEAQINNAFKFSTLKLVLDGHALYNVNRKSYRLSQNEYLICNGDQKGEGFIDSKKAVSQFCVHLKPSFVNDAYRSFGPWFEAALDSPYDECLDFRFFENTYNLNSSTGISRLLRPLAAMIELGKGNEIHLDEEWLLQLTETIILNEKNIKLSLNGLKQARPATRDEIMKRLLIGKEYMDSFFMDSPKIAEIARLAFMSEFFFYRNFKMAFRTTPHQYILNKKIGLAKEMMYTEKMTLVEIAASCGFPDIHTFSKAFKRKFGSAPSKIREFYDKRLAS